MDTNIPQIIANSGSPYSGAFPNHFQETRISESPNIPNQTGAMIPTMDTNTASFVAHISGDPSYGTYCSSHLEGFTPQDATSIQVPSSLPMTTYNYISYVPLTPPPNINNSYLWLQIRKLKGTPLEKYLEKFFIHRGFRVIRTQASHDKGADLILERGWEKIVVQVKGWDENVGILAIEVINSAKDYYKATHAIIIITGKFTKFVTEFAKALNVECWDGERLLQEIYKSQFFYLRE